MKGQSQKEAAGKQAVTYIKNNMIVGLGSGSTAQYMLKALAQRIKNENLNIIGVPTSKATAKEAKKLNIPIKDIDEVDHIDLTIDGADEINQNYQGIKGGGGSHFREKIIAFNSKINIWIADESKLHKNLGQHTLPIEVNPFGYSHLFKTLKNNHYHPKMRKSNDSTYFLTDSQNYIIDIHPNNLNNPIKLEQYLNSLPGVITTGLFINIADIIIVGRPKDTKVIQVNNHIQQVTN